MIHIAEIIGAQPGLIQGNTDALEMFLKVFAGEVLAAFERKSVTLGRHQKKTIESGKSAYFPVVGRAVAKYLKPGASLDDQRENIPNSQKLILLDGLLTSDVLIFDLLEAMNNWDERSVYVDQCAKALASGVDTALLAEVAKAATITTPLITGPQGTGVGGVLTASVSAADAGISEAAGKAIIQLLLKAMARMNDNHVDEEGRYCYLSPTNYAALLNSWSVINRDYGAVGTIMDGKISKIYGFDIIPTANITAGDPDFGNELQGEGHAFPAQYKNSDPILICHHSSVGTLTLKNLATEHGRRIDYQADHVVTKLACGHAWLRPEASFMGIINVA